ncbi:hypothetical protein ScPMuIL_004598 [Solemya velum]
MNGGVGYRLEITFEIDVPAWSSQQDDVYKRLLATVVESLERSYREAFGSLFFGLDVTLMSLGSLLVDHTIYIDDSPEVARSVSAFIADILQGRTTLRIGGRPAPVGRVVLHGAGGEAHFTNDESSPCSILDVLRPCRQGYTCKRNDYGKPVCTAIQESKLNVILGAVIGVLVGAIIITLVIVACWCSKHKHEGDITSIHRQRCSSFDEKRSGGDVSSMSSGSYRSTSGARERPSMLYEPHQQRLSGEKESPM